MSGLATSLSRQHNTQKISIEQKEEGKTTHIYSNIVHLTARAKKSLVSCGKAFVERCKVFSKICVIDPYDARK